jgi:hypothetical protein
MARIYSMFKSLFEWKRIKLLIEIFGFVVLVSTLIVGGYTILTMGYAEIYNTDDKLQAEFQNSDDLNKLYVLTGDPFERVQFMLGGKHNSLKWTTIHELKSKMYSSNYFNKTKPLRIAHNFCTRVLSLSERVYYTFHPASPIIAFLDKHILGFDVNKYGGGLPWIKDWIRDMSSNPIFLVAFDDFIHEGGVEDDVCIELKTIMKQEIEKENNTVLINKIYPELFDEKHDLCKKEG